MSKEQIDYIKDSIACYDELIRLFWKSIGVSRHKNCP